jgi:glycosyltransferase involved in cell wall biosynthesis
MKLEASAARPSLSVVVVIFAGPAYLDRCLQALLLQTSVHDVEIIVPCDESVPDLSGLQKKFPAIRFLTSGGHRTFAELRALGVAKARGAIIATTEDHCTPNPDWCERILQAHRGSYAAVGGAVEKSAPDTALNWAVYLADYGRYMNPKEEGFSSELTDGNVSYKTSALYAIADVWQSEFHEHAVHGALRARGEVLWFSPDIIVYQQRSVSLGQALRDRYVFGRLFGSGRVITAPLLRRLLYAVFCIVLPPLLVGRIARHVFIRQRHVGTFMRSFPALVMVNAAWAWGEFLGYLTGRPEISLTPARSADPRPQESEAT